MNHHPNQHNGISHLSDAPATLYTFFLPLNHNDGRLIEPERLKAVERAILQRVSGLTRLPPGIGFWMSPALQMFRDMVMPIQVVVFHDRVSEEWFAHWALEAAELLEQHNVFVLAQPAWPIAGLTDREREVLGLLPHGLRNKEIAQRLGINESTVETHLRNIIAKLGMKNRTEAASLAVRYGLSKDELENPG